MKILFMGSNEFSIEVLKKILNSSHQVVAVVCQPDRELKKGKAVFLPIKTFAAENNLPVLQFENINNNLKQLLSLDFDVFVTASFGQIIANDLIESKLGLNVHPSALPHLRGATPIQTALMNGEKSIGVTIQKMAFKVDSGDVADCKFVDVDNQDTSLSLFVKTGIVGGEILVKVLNNIENNCQVFTPQKHDNATFTKMIKKEDGLLDFCESAENIVNKIRAIGENPGCFVFVGGERIKIKKAEVAQDNILNLDNKNFASGDVFFNKKMFTIKAKDGFVQVLNCQAENGKLLEVKDFLNGYKFKAEKVDL